jgi:hypothetical protein
MSAKQIYIVLEKPGRACITHSKDGKDYYPGDAIDLSHLSKEQIDWFVKNGHVKPEGVAKEVEVKNG